MLFVSYQVTVGADKYSVSYCFHHYGHDPEEDVPVQGLPNSVRTDMYELLKKGVPATRIYLDIRHAAFRQYSRGSYADFLKS